MSEKLLKDLENDFHQTLKKDFNFLITDKEPQSIFFEYPKIFESNYLSQSVKLEIGSLAAWTPAIEVDIKPIIADLYSNVFKQGSTIRTVSAERTFWEKATILHHEANRPKRLDMPHRYARHYYDLYKMAQSNIKEKAIKNRDLLNKVTKFKMKFYPRGWANYGDILDGKIKLVPNSYRFKEIEEDYRAMSEMIYGYYPSFDELMNQIIVLEKSINNAIS